MSETALLQEIRMATGQDADYRGFRNNVGALKDVTGRLVRYGLGVGTSDIIGIKAVKITPEMVGQTVGLFTAIEVKAQDGRLTKEQHSFIRMVRALGGRAGVARSIKEAKQILEGQYDADDIR